MMGIDVTYTEKSKYKIYLAESGWYDLVNFIKKNYSNKKILLVSDSDIPAEYYWQVIKDIDEFVSFTLLFVIPSGEKSKQVSYINKIHKNLFKENFNRDDLVIAFGGGVIGDLTGFAASIYKRGIPYIQVPTTLLSMVDSSVGGKTAINTEYAKNSIGSFYNPEAVFVNTETLNTLEHRHFLNGLAEVIKCAIIGDKAMYALLSKEKEKILNKDPSIIQDLILRSLKVKVSVVSKDTKEKGQRALLNLGHTSAHAIEKASRNRILHGEAVALGILVETKILEAKNILSREDQEKIFDLIKMYGYMKVPTKLINLKQISKYIQQDKKNTGFTVRITRVTGIGNNLNNVDVFENVEMDEIRNHLIYILNGGN